MDSVTLAAASAPAWISFVSLGVAVASACTATWTLLHNRHRNLRQDRQRYAEKVSAWSEPDKSNEEEGSEGTCPQRLVVMNGSSQPLYSVRLFPSGSRAGAHVRQVDVGFVPPNERIEVKNYRDGKRPADERTAVAFQFIDGAERGWLRHKNGRLLYRSPEHFLK